MNNKTTGIHYETSLSCPPTDDDIDERALELWECYHRPEGRDKEIRLQAERQLLGLEPLVNPPTPDSPAVRVFNQAPARDKPCARLDPAMISQTAARAA